MQPNPWVLIAGGFHRQGGMDQANFSLANYLAGEGIPVHLVTHNAERDLLANSCVHLHWVPRPLGSFAMARPLLDLAGRRVARQTTARSKHTTVLVNGGNCRWPGINWAHYIHHAWEPELPGGPLLERSFQALAHRLEKRRELTAYRHAKLIFANSEVTRRTLIEDLGMASSVVKTLYLGTGPEWRPATPLERIAGRHSFRIAPDSHVAAFVGGIGSDNRKGLDTLLQAWQILCADPHWDVDLLVAGGGRSLPQCQSAIHKLGLDARVRTLGFCSDVRGLLAAADILVSPTRYEPYGLNVQEAICRGLPAIVSASAGIAERYPGNLQAFLLRDPENASSLAAHLRLWRANVEAWQQRFAPLGTLLRANSWRDTARNLVSIVQEQQAASARA